MKKRILYLISVSLILSCSRVPVTNRRQVNMLPEATLINMGVTSYRDFLSKNPVSKSPAEIQMVKSVGNNIAAAVTQFLRQKKMLKRIEGYKWEFNLVEDKSKNAWCMPGGKVVVYSGILPVTQDETGLAVVMGHEIAHAIARHGNERMSQQLLVQLGGIGLSVAISQKPQQTQDIFLQSYGIGTQLGTLKYSRKHESEADKLGLIFMAMAGYDPEKAVDFWQRMAKSADGGRVPELLSTHPSDETRIKDIREFLPTAKKYYRSIAIK